MAKKFNEKIAPKRLQNTFGHFWERFWAFLEFWKFFDFFWKFLKTRPSMEDCAKKLSKKCLKTCLKHVWSVLGTILGIFGILKFFWFFWKVLKTRPSMEDWAKNIFSKNLPQNMFKTRLVSFGNDFGHFWNFEKFLIFLKNFEDSTLHGRLGKKKLRKNCPKTCSNYVWTILGTILSIFGILKNFWFFWKILKTRPSMEDWAKKNFEKIAPKHVQITFGQFWERFWAFLEFWKFFDFLKIFSQSLPHILSPENWTHIFKFGNLNSLF